MSLTYSTLKAQILEDSHRSDLSLKVDDFVRQAEGQIFRMLRAAEMIKRVDLDDTDRVTVDEGFYTLPSDYLEQRSLYLNGSNPRALESVSLAELRQVSGSNQVRHYSVISDSEIEFRGVPSTDDTIELIYFARPAVLVDDDDTNSILTRHETIYLNASLAALYNYTQDLELAQKAQDTADAAITTLNEQAGRLLGGARTYGGYNLSTFGAR